MVMLTALVPTRRPNDDAKRLLAAPETHDKDGSAERLVRFPSFDSSNNMVEYAGEAGDVQITAEVGAAFPAFVSFPCKCSCIVFSVFAVLYVEAYRAHIQRNGVERKYVAGWRSICPIVD